MVYVQSFRINCLRPSDEKMITAEATLVFILCIVNINSLNAENVAVVDVRTKRAVLQGPIRLINEPACKEIKNLCNTLPVDADDLTVLECVQTFLTSQIESLSDECQHVIWSHTSEVCQRLKYFILNELIYFSVQ